jgi:hypothetical protein
MEREGEGAHRERRHGGGGLLATPVLRPPHARLIVSFTPIPWHLTPPALNPPTVTLATLTPLITSSHAPGRT